MLIIEPFILRSSQFGSLFELSPNRDGKVWAHWSNINTQSRDILLRTFFFPAPSPMVTGVARCVEETAANQDSDKYLLSLIFFYKAEKKSMCQTYCRKSVHIRSGFWPISVNISSQICQKKLFSERKKWIFGNIFDFGGKIRFSVQFQIFVKFVGFLGDFFVDFLDF